MTGYIGIATEYSHQADELEQFISDCSEPVAIWRPAEDRWSILEIAAHLADAELLASARIRRIITQDRANLFGYKQEWWAQKLGYRRQRIETVSTRFVFLRRENAELIESIADEVWQFKGRHDEDGELSLRQLIEGYIAHTAKHLNQMRAVAGEFTRQSTMRTER
ncbi:MAG: DinB family protein [Blastocatellia bacterium]